MSILFCFPPSYPVTASTFNYAPVSLLACIAFGILYWITTARHNFHGPKRTIDDLDSEPEFVKPAINKTAENTPGNYGGKGVDGNGKNDTVLQVDGRSGTQPLPR